MSQLRIPGPIDAHASRSAGPAPRVERLRLAGTPSVVVFDLDGTLVDTAPDLTASLNHCLRRAGLPEATLDEVRPFAGLGSRVMLETAYRCGGRLLGEAELSEQTRCFLDYYQAHIADLSQPFAGAIDAMDRLQASGCLLAICTNKVEALSRLLVEALGLADRFVAICGADTFHRRKPDPVHLLGTIDRAGASADCAVMIGDTATDIDAAWSAGVPSILVDFGYAPDHAARAAADRILSSYDELDRDLVDELITSRRRAG